MEEFHVGIPQPENAMFKKLVAPLCLVIGLVGTVVMLRYGIQVHRMLGANTLGTWMNQAFVGVTFATMMCLGGLVCFQRRFPNLGRIDSDH